MKLTKQQKTFAAVLAVALVALTADRLFLGGGPSAAEAAEAPRPDDLLVTDRAAPGTADRAASRGAAAGRAGLGARLNTLAERFEDSADDAALDAFSPPASWLQMVRASKQAGDKPQITPQGVSIPAFRLTLLTRDADRQIVGAVINGKLRALGDQIEGYTLVGFTDKPAGVVLSGAAGQIPVRLITDANAGTDNAARQ